MTTIILDATKPENLSSRVLEEKETRKRLLSKARHMGCEKEMMMLFIKADNMRRLCTNDKERADMGKMFCVEMYRLLGGGGELYLDGMLVCKED